MEKVIKITEIRYRFTEEEVKEKLGLQGNVATLIREYPTTNHEDPPEWVITTREISEDLIQCTTCGNWIKGQPCPHC